ncbi:hypothetical protein LTR66_006075 [Elasticomyces elasticus]|nr:hypothetical protein LTR50_007300 [Elasticomyces elasticus]KAK4993201.1 hypothetical protein LTR66_006075 [Elasticomyces elasticus]
MFVPRKWRTARTMIGLFVVEFAFTIAALALFGIAAPNTYRKLLWQDGADLGYSSNPNEILYSYANYRPMSVPLVWSQFVTNFNVIISVLSMFILLAKSVMFVMHVFIPPLSVFVHALLLALYAWLTPQRSGLFAIYLLLSIYSCVPTKMERESRGAVRDFENIPEYSPEMKQSAQHTQDYPMQPMRLQMPRIPGTAGGFSSPMTPRTVAFHALEGDEPTTGARKPIGKRGLPFRERYEGPDGR